MSELHVDLLKIMEKTGWLEGGMEPDSSDSGENEDALSSDGFSTCSDDSWDADDPNIVRDSYCWICHHYCQDLKCRYCPRVFHEMCAERIRGFILHTCPVCLRASVDESLPASPFRKEQLSIAFSLAMEKIFKHFSMFRSWPEHENNERLIKKTDLYGILDQISAETYIKPVHFFSDVQWLVHNCSLVYGVRSDEAKEAKRMIEKLKGQLLQIEACPECYEKENTKEKAKTNTFVELCTSPHLVIFAKIKGFPEWPAKCLKVIEDIAIVKFFGKHEISRVRLSECSLMTKPSRVSVKRHRSAYMRSINEMKRYIVNYEAKYGAFRYAEPKTRFIPREHQIIRHSMGRNLAYESEHGTRAFGLAGFNGYSDTEPEHSADEDGISGEVTYKHCLQVPSRYTKDEEKFVFMGRLPSRGHFLRTTKGLWIYK